jgi:hypothetical protein
MKSQIHKRFGFMIIVLIALLGWTTSGQQKRTEKQWEYQFFGGYVSPDEVKRLNELGAQGWELVAIHPHDSDHVDYFLKRAK